MAAQYAHTFITYTGDGAASRAVTGLGFQPDLVLVKVRSNDAGRGGGCLRTTNMTGQNSLPIPGAALITNGILSLDADGFTVGAATRVNDNLVQYVALCIRVANDWCRIGTYTGDGADNRSITIATGYQPEFMLIFGTTGNGVYRSENHTGDASTVLANDTTTSNLIQAFEANGFQVGSDADVNANTSTYFYIAWRSNNTAHFDDIIKSGSYVGNGAAPQAVTGVGFQPGFVLVGTDESGIDAGWKHSSMASTNGSAWSASGLAATWVRLLDADGFTVGINLDTLSQTYYYLALLETGVLNPNVLAGSLAPYPRLQFIDENGDVYASGELSMREAGISTPLAPFTNEALSTPHADPIVLDAGGRATIYLDDERYKGILKTSDGRTVWSVDPIPATHLLAQQQGKRLPIGGSDEQGVSDTSYATGAGAENLIPGSKILRLDSDDLLGSWRLRGMLKTDGGVVTAALMNLSDGAPDTALVTISSVSTRGEQVMSAAAITFPAGGTTKSYGVKLQAASGVGFAWGLELIREG